MAGCAALILAAGRGTRLGTETPKQFLPLAGQTVLARAAQAFIGHPSVSAVRVVIADGDEARYGDATRGLDLLPPVTGGATRQESGLRGLESLEDQAPDTVLIHDAARPLIDRGTIDRVLAALARTPGALPGLPVPDTLKRETGNPPVVAETVERSGLWRAQTPQGFRFRDILDAHRAGAGLDLTDDAAVAEHAGLALSLVRGEEENFKVTTSDDLERAERLLSPSAPVLRFGTGYDVHALGPGDHVVLCGVRIPHDGSLIGHSDSDAALHALTDALLGAIAEADIGAHFSPTDERWRDASSDIFLRHAAGLVAAKGGEIVNVDVTIVCERPRIAPHREAMRARVSEILGIGLDRVSVKATTTEGLGFAGRGEGIIAQAAASVRLPGDR